VYNSSIASFWACPASAGSNKDGQQQQEAAAANFYLEVPEHLQEKEVAGQARSSGPCKRVAIEVRFTDTWFCNHEFPFSKSGSVQQRAATIAASETTVTALGTAPARDASSGLVAATETTVLKMAAAAAQGTASVPASTSEGGTVMTTPCYTSVNDGEPY
jgi:hypothetical protein